MKNITSSFLDFEEKNNLFNLYIGDFQVWPYVRFTIFQEIVRIINNQVQINSKNNYNFIKIFIRVFINNPILRVKKSDILFITHARRLKINEKYECIYTDDLARKYESSSASLEFLYRGKHLEPISTKNIIYLDYIDIIPGILLGLYKIKYFKELKILKKISIDIVELIFNEFNINIGNNFLIKCTQKRFIWYCLKKNMLHRLIKKITPKVIIETVSYETGKMIINEIAKEMKIPTVELQHGVITRGHIAYNFNKKCEYPFLPQYICLFSEFWKKNASFAQDDKNIIISGFPYLELMMQQYPKVIRSEQDFHSCRKILCISQPGYNFVSEVVKFIKFMDSNAVNFKIFYKLHPVEYDTFDYSIFQKYDNIDSVEIVGNNLSLYYLFSQCDIQVGMTSTAIYEGLAYNLMTYILRLGSEVDVYMNSLCKQGYATMCEDGYDLGSKIKNLQYNSLLQHTKDLKTTFFVSNALDNLSRFIDDKFFNKNTKLS